MTPEANRLLALVRLATNPGASHAEASNAAIAACKMLQAQPELVAGYEPPRSSTSSSSNVSHADIHEGIRQGHRVVQHYAGIVEDLAKAIRGGGVK